MAIHNRRQFIRNATLVSVGFPFLARCASIPSQSSQALPVKGLVADVKGYLDLPEGFSYKVISQAGNAMVDGFIVPGRPDGMGAFDLGAGRLAIIRNHENSPEPAKHSPFGEDLAGLSKIDPEMLYDAGKGEMPGLGGTTTIIYNEETGEVEQEFLSLAGTYRNCAGGVTPWNTWITCEEDVTVQGGKVEQDHGYVFEVPVTENPTLHKPIPIKEMGRFNHEAVAVDPNTGIVYLTEDAGDGLIYRFIPQVKGALHKGGRLQAMALMGKPKKDTRNWERKTMYVGQSKAVEWIDLDNVDPKEDDLRLRGYEMGALRFARGEGIWFGEGEVYFACTNGGPNKHGQVFKYIPSPEEGTTNELAQPGQLELFAESEDQTVLHMCDNLTIAPSGHVVLCEDNGVQNHIRGINPTGKIYNIACNRSSDSEFAGVVFSPSGKTLFVNIQENGDTLAITGPWETLG